MNEKRWLALILTLYGLFAFTYSWLIPPWEGPDEPAHYVLALNLATVGIFSSIEDNYEAGQPQTYYWLASGPLKILHSLNREWVKVFYPERDYGNVRKPAPIFFWSDANYRFLPGLYTLRWLNICMGMGALLLNYAAARRLMAGRFQSQQPLQSLPSQTVPLAALALAALTPQFLHITSSVANDTLGILGGGILFWLMSRVIFEQVSLRELGIAFVLAFLLPYLTKLTVLPVGMALVIVIGVHIRNRWPGKWRQLVLAGLALGGSALMLGLWLAPRMGNLFIRQFKWRAFSFEEDALSWEYLREMVKQVVWSYWGLAGWLQVRLPGWAVFLLTGLGAFGAGAEGLWRRGGEGERRAGGMWAVWLVAGLSVAAVLKNGLNTIYSQGRFLFPAIGALAFLMVSGWERWLPARFRGYLLPGIIVLMIGANLFLWFLGILPVYYQPFLE